MHPSRIVTSKLVSLVAFSLFKKQCASNSDRLADQRPGKSCSSPSLCDQQDYKLADPDLPLLLKPLEEKSDPRTLAPSEGGGFPLFVPDRNLWSGSDLVWDFC